MAHSQERLGELKGNVFSAGILLCSKYHSGPRKWIYWVLLSRFFSNMNIQTKYRDIISWGECQVRIHKVEQCIHGSDGQVPPSAWLFFFLRGPCCSRKQAVFSEKGILASLHPCIQNEGGGGGNGGGHKMMVGEAGHLPPQFSSIFAVWPPLRKRTQTYSMLGTENAFESWPIHNTSLI